MLVCLKQRKYNYGSLIHYVQPNTITCLGRLWNFLCNFVPVTLKALPIEIQHFFSRCNHVCGLCTKPPVLPHKKTRIFFRCRHPPSRYLGSCSQIHDCSWTIWEQSRLEAWRYSTRERKCSQAECPPDYRDLWQWGVEGACKWQSASQDWPRQIVTSVFFRWNATLGWGYRRGKE